MANKVPSIPPLSSISDPSTRAVLQALVDQTRIRNGEVGNGDQQFLTAADLTAAVSGSPAMSGSSSTTFFTSINSATANAVSNIIQKVSDTVMQSREWKLLDETIGRIEMPEWFQGKFGAAIQSEQRTRESGLNAIAQGVTTAVANINDNVALVQEEITAVASSTDATAQAVTQLQASVGGISAAAQQALSLSASVSGTVNGMWSVKFDVNGYVAGVALGVQQTAGQPPKSNFVVRADTFAVGAPGAQDAVPFVVQNGTCYLKKAMIGQAWIDEAMIANLAVTEGKIQNLAVDTLKIKDFAVSTIFYAGGIFEASVALQAAQPCTVHLIAVFTQGTGKTGHEWLLSASGAVLHGERPIQNTTGSLAGATNLPAGLHTCKVSCANTTGDARCQLVVFMRYK